jgi:hypothetical protein
MEKEVSFPSRVSIQVHPADQDGLAVILRFKSSIKNDFDYIAFVDSTGRAELHGDELLRSFDEDRDFFIMDYADPRFVFTGQITAEVLSTVALEGAVDVLRQFTSYSFPKDYKKNLRRAALQGQNPDKYQVAVDVQYK